MQWFPINNTQIVFYYVLILTNTHLNKNVFSSPNPSEQYVLDISLRDYIYPLLQAVVFSKHVYYPDA